MSVITLSACRPKSGCDLELWQVLHDNLDLLIRQGLIAPAPTATMVASDGTVVQLIAWLSDEARTKAHTDPAVQEAWHALAQLCDYLPLASLPEMQGPFARFAVPE